MTGSLRIGDFWSNIPNYEIRAICPHCQDTTESLTHILTECETEENAIVWELTKHAWPESTTNWTTPTLGHILGCGCLTPATNEQGASSPKQRGMTRLKRILLSEAAYLLWTLRCNRVIDNHTSTRTAITTKWRNATSVKRKHAGSTGLNHIVAVVTCRQRCLFPFQLSTTSTTVAPSLYDNRYIGSPKIEFNLHRLQ